MLLLTPYVGGRKTLGPSPRGVKFPATLLVPVNMGGKIRKNNTPEIWRIFYPVFPRKHLLHWEKPDFQVYIL